jgi:mRNA interferase HicA
LKKRDLERALSGLGWRLKREGGSHEIWTNGKRSIPIPRHKDINERLAKHIIEDAKKG